MVSPPSLLAFAQHTPLTRRGCSRNERPLSIRVSGGLTAFGRPRQDWDVTYIDDIVTANISLQDTAAAEGEVMNTSSTDNIEIETLAREIRDQLDPDFEVTYERRHDADAGHTHASTNRVHEGIGYEPTHSIRDGVSECIEWYRLPLDWYQPLVLRSEATCRAHCIARFDQYP